MCANGDKLIQDRKLHSGIKHFRCSVCGKQFATDVPFHAHMRTPTGEKPYGCKFCEKKYTLSSGLTLHIEAVHGIEALKQVKSSKTYRTNRPSDTSSLE